MSAPANTEAVPVNADRFAEGVCCVCARPDAGIAVQRGRGRNDFAWICDDRSCFEQARQSIGIPQDKWTAIDLAAQRAGGAEGGAYLAELGVASFSDLTEPQWNEFLRRVIGGYRAELKFSVSTEAPF